MDKAILLKKIRRKYFTSKKEIYKNLYKKNLATYHFIKDIADTKTLKPAQGKFRQYQLDVYNFCYNWLEKFKDIGVEYFAISGNLLGAYRNGGFIPWDDDFDIGMLRKDFQKLIDYLRTNYREVSTDKIYFSLNNRSVIVKDYVEKYPNEIMLAVFPTHLQILYGNNMENLLTLDIQPFDYYSNDYSLEEHRKYEGYLKQKRAEIDNFSDIKKWLENERKNNKNIVEDSDIIFHGVDSYDTYFLPVIDFFSKSDIYPLRTIMFENKNICMPNNPEKYLYLNYGQGYMDMPNNIPINSHINYRLCTGNKTAGNKHLSQEKNRIIKFLKRKFFSDKTQKYKQLYKKIKPRVDLLMHIIDVKTIKPCQDKNLRKYQLDNLEFCREMTDLFEKNGLEYFITSGTLIGAVRHKGFVPWDDDFDVGMMRKDYEKLKIFLKDHFKEVDLSDASYGKWDQYKIMNNALKSSNGQTVFMITPKYIQIYRGSSFSDSVTIDIFPHEFYKDGYTKALHKDIAADLEKQMRKLDDYKDIMEMLAKRIAESKDIVEKGDIIYYGYDSLGTYVVNPTTLMSYDMIFPRRKMLFEGYEFYAPNNPDGYIKVQYPDYWSIPKLLSIAPFYKDKLLYKKIC